MSSKAKMVLVAAAVMLIAAIGPALAQKSFVETEVKKGEVVRVNGQTVVVRVEGEGIKLFNVKGDMTFTLEDGRRVTVEQLRPGMVVTTTRFISVDEPQVLTESDVEKVMGAPSPPPPPPAQAAPPARRPVTQPASPPPPPPAPPKQLPKTGSTTPLVALLGLLALAVGAGLTVTRRFLG